MAGKGDLARASKAKNDEFYTQLSDIEAELRHYRDDFAGKVVLCNCDDPYESNFFKYFAMNFNHLGLKKLIATSFSGSPITGTQLSLMDMAGAAPSNPPSKASYCAEITNVPDHNKDGAIDITDVEYLLKQDPNVIHLLDGDGDFRSAESVALLEQADIVVTNPPFSLFREFLAQLVEHEKKFVMIGNTNALTYQEVFKLIKEGQLRTGYTNFNVGMHFTVPDDRDEYHYINDEGKKMVRVSTSCWYTNLEVSRHRQPITLYRSYNPDEYPTYDNYDAIEVGKYTEIPQDYEGPMGVPITFLDKYSPDQFEILGWTRGRDEFEARPTKKYVNARQIKADGSETSGSKVNTGPTLLHNKRPPKGTSYVADGVDGFLVQPYMRVIVRNRNPTKTLES